MRVGAESEAAGDHSSRQISPGAEDEGRPAHGELNCMPQNRGLVEHKQQGSCAPHGRVTRLLLVPKYSLNGQ